MSGLELGTDVGRGDRQRAIIEHEKTSVAVRIGEVIEEDSRTTEVASRIGELLGKLTGEEELNVFVDASSASARFGRERITILTEVDVRFRLVDLAVAVVVESVARFRRERIDRLLLVVAVAALSVVRRSDTCEHWRCGRVAVEIAVRVWEKWQKSAFVGVSTAVVVPAVAQFLRARVGREDIVATVAIIEDVSVLCLITRLFGETPLAVAVAVPVVVEVPRHGVERVYVDLSVAVVVDLVAQLLCARIGRRGVVVAIVLCGDEKVRAGTPVHELLFGIAVTVAVAVVIPQLARGIIGLPVAVVVRAVADFVGVGIDARLAVVAVLAVVDVTVRLLTRLRRVLGRAEIVVVVVCVPEARRADVLAVIIAILVGRDAIVVLVVVDWNRRRSRSWCRRWRWSWDLLVRGLHRAKRILLTTDDKRQKTHNQQISHDCSSNPDVKLLHKQGRFLTFIAKNVK